MGRNIKYYKTKYIIDLNCYAVFFYKIDFFDHGNDNIIRVWIHGDIEDETYPVNQDFLTRCTEITKEEYESAYEL